MDSPYVTLVGGTTLTTSNTIGGTVTNVFYESETVWNQNPGGAGNTNNSVSGGGIGTVHSIPNWQQGINLSACGGSTSQRNVPDVALTAQSVFVAANNGWEYNEGGTSAAAPLWAGFTALINQQAAANGQPAVGFLNPAIYAIGESAIYSNCFNDVTTGNNETYYSPNQYSAVSGYDLCTGWGTPTGSNLINALSAPPTEGNSWISGAGGKWEAAAHWSLTIPPDSLQSIFISNAPSKTVTIDATTSGSNPSTMTNRNVIVSAPAGTVNTLFLNNAGTTTTPLQILNSLTITSGGAVAVTNSTLLLDPVNSVSGIDGVIVGETASDKQLTVAGGGQLTGVNGYIGYNSSSEDDYVLVSGSGSAWSNSRYLYVGDYGSFNELSIADGGTVSSAGCAIGNYPNANFNGMVVSGPGAVCASSGTLYVGQYGSFNQLYIQDGGVVSNANGYIGWAAGGNDNAGSVTGTGSGWYNSGTLSVGYSSSGNTLTIAGGGIVSNADGYIGYNHGANGNAGTVTDPGSVWNSASDLYIGYYGSGNSLTITNGAAVLTQGTAGIGWWPSNVNNVVTVSGNGAQWLISGTLYVGYPGTGNQLVINPGGTVAASGAFIGEDYVTLANNNVLQVSGGNLFVTNSAGTGQLTVGLSTGPASLLLYSGTVVVDNLVANHNANSLIQLNGGLLASGGTSISNGQIFSVGDGVTAATFQLNGGVHSFANNLLIGNNATLTGCGTVNGNVVVGYGGTVLADCGTLTFVNVITNNGVLRVDGGSVLETYSNVVNNGTIDAINGGTSFHAGILNHGTILTPANVAISQASPSGQDFVVQVPSVTGHTYQLQYTTSLAPATWTNTGAPQSGTGAVLTFTDVGAITNSQRFYQVLVTAP
jgi:T5SS/PEP-CTERM-associated repeat protein